MEEVNVKKVDKVQYDLHRFLPLIISILVIVCTGLSFIGHVFVVSHYEGEVFIQKEVTMANLLFSQDAGINTQLYFIVWYLVFPIIACVLLIFSKNHKFFATGAMIIFLLVAVSAIVSDDLYGDAIKYFYRIKYEVKYSFDVTDLSFSFFIIIICYFVAFILSFIASFRHYEFSVKDITEMGVMIAAAIGLNFIKIMPMPTGGSVNLQMLPLFFLALRRGPLKGFVGGGIVYGLITCLTDGWGFASYPLDYLLGFGSIAVIGFFSPYILVPGEKNYTVKGELLLLLAGVIATTVRFIAGTVSSMVIYGYELVPAMAYNSLYVYVSGALSLAILMALLGPIRRINARFPVGQEISL